MGETRAETDADKSSDAGATGPRAAGRDEAAASDGTFCGGGWPLARGVSGGSSKPGATPIRGLRSPTNGRSWPGTGPR